MKKSFTLVCILTGLVSHLEAASIGINFVGSNTAMGTLSSSTVAGLPAFQQASWNNLSGASTFNDTTFIDTDGQSFTVSKPGGVDAVTGVVPLNVIDGLHDANDQLMSGFLSGERGSSDKLHFLSLPESYIASGYSVIVYADGTANTSESISLDANQVGDFTSRRFYLRDTTTFSGAFIRATSTSSATPTVGANYVQFDNLTASSFTLLMSPTDGSSSRYFNAVQVVQAIPEPASIALFFAGISFGVVLLRRRRPNPES